MANHENSIGNSNSGESVSGPELEYPKALVDRYGAKAGFLLHIARHLPDIPQARMLVNEPAEPAEQFIERVRKANLQGSLLVRSSAVAEMTGYEGAFPTVRVYREADLERQIEFVRTSPTWLKERGDVGDEVPDEINVIVAEKASSSHIGTYIKHPNQHDNYLIAITEAQSLLPFMQGGRFGGALRFAYAYTPQGGVEFLERYTKFMDHEDRPAHLEDQLALVASWHDRISSLPDIDPNWAYQIEFGINPPCLFQVRPFKPYQKVDFTIDNNGSLLRRFAPIVIGTTTPEGIIARVVDARSAADIKDEPIVVIDSMRHVGFIDRQSNHQANLLSGSFGFLQHEDIAAIRQARVTALYASNPDIAGGSKSGEHLRIISDGKNIKVENVNYDPTEDDIVAISIDDSDDKI